MTTQFTTNLDGRLLDLVSGRLARALDAAGVTTPEQFVKLGPDGLRAVRGAGVATAKEYLSLLPDAVEMLGRDFAWLTDHETGVLHTDGPFDRAKALRGIGPWSDEPAINAGAAEIQGVPDVLHEVYYEALVEGANERIAALLAE